jgi:hypothetical protein
VRGKKQAVLEGGRRKDKEDTEGSEEKEIQ